MNTIAELIGPLYSKLLTICSKYNISLDLDIQDPSLSFDDLTEVRNFLYTQLKRALENCKPGDKVIISEHHNDKFVRFSVKDSGKTLTKSQQEALREQNYEVRARYGYDNIVTVKFEIV